MKPASTLTRSYTLLLLGLGSACAGGGGSVHRSPGWLEADRASRLHLELSVWGWGSGAMTDRYTNVTCHYRTIGTADYQTIAMAVDSTGEERLFTSCALPPFSGGSRIEYYFTFDLDGHPNRRSADTVTVQ